MDYNTYMKQKKKTGSLFMERIPLWTQLFVIITVIFSFLVGFILIKDYNKNRQMIIEQKVVTSRRLLELEMQNLEQYIKELAAFCIQPRHDTEFMTSIIAMDPLTVEQEEAIRRQMQIYYFSRADLNSYEIYFCHQDTAFGRLKSTQHISQLSFTDIPETEGFLECCEGPYYNAIFPSDNKDGFIEYYQSIIRIQDQIPEAVVRLEADTSFMDKLSQEHKNSQEILCVLNKHSQVLYTGEEFIKEDMLNEAMEMEAGNFSSIFIEGTEYLCVGYTGENYGLCLLSFLPMSVIHGEITSVLRTSVMFGIGVWIIALVITFALIRLTMRPLRTLSRQMTKVGAGDFQKVMHIGGSQEITELSESLNDMVEHIERLIEQNYVAEINEKTLRLTALEAQLNPHFLYNTLQAIGTEALINDQPQINEMLTSLASNMRYSIKGGDLVALKSEMTYVKNYVLLQKVRLEDRFEIELNVEEGLENLQIPKISIQTLVENSVIHGMGPDSDSIAVKVQVKCEEEFLYITVSDDGCGIEPEHLASMQNAFRDYLKPGEVGKIGLANLYSRLQILYQGQAELLIESNVGRGTVITMKIPVEYRR